MLFARIRGAVVFGGAVVMLLGATDSALAQCGCLRPAAVVPAPTVAMMPVTAMAPVTACAPACGVTRVPYHANRMMWTPSYGISSTCNPFAARSCGYGVATCMTPVAVGGAPCGPYMAATPVATTTYRPFLYRLFHPFTPLVPTTTYRVAFCSPVAPCAPSCAPACAPACAPMASCGPACPTPTLNYAPACDPCGSAMGTAGGYGAAVPGCPSGACAPAVTTTPTPTPSLPQTYEGAAPLSAPLPSPVESNGDMTPRTYKEGEQPSTQPDVRLKPAPDTKSDAPRLIDPVTQHTARPIRTASYLVPVSRSVEAKKPAPQEVDFGGWRASRD